MPLFQIGERRDEDEPDVLDAGLVHLVLRADDRRRDAVALGQADGRVGAGELRLGGVDVRAVLEGRLDHGLLVDRRDVGGQGELAERLGGAGRLGDADLVAQVGQGREVILPGRLDLLARRPALDPRQRDVGGRDLVGLHPPLERLQQPVVEVGELLGQAVLLAAVGGRLEEPVGLDQGRQLGLNTFHCCWSKAAWAMW